MVEIKVGTSCYTYMYRYANIIHTRTVYTILISLFNSIVTEILEASLAVFVFKNNLFLRYSERYLYLYDNNI